MNKVIISSAIKYPNGSVITGRRHGDVIATAAQLGLSSRGPECIQGFIDNTNKFYTREEAKELAVKNGQVPKSHKGELYSEDLWPGPELEVED